MPSPTLSIIIPAYNEEKRLPAYLSQVIGYCKNLPVSYEILVVDDGSADKTFDVAGEMLGAGRVVRLPKNSGKGAAIRVGMKKAKGKYRLFTDADGSTPIAEEARLRALLDTGFAIAIGSREAMHPEVKREVLRHRRFIGRVFAFLVQKILSLPVQDSQCGFKMFRDDVAEQLVPLTKMNGFIFDVEWLFIAKQLGHSIAEVAVNWTEVKGSKVNLVKDSTKMLMGVLSIRWNNRRLPKVTTRKENQAA